MSLKELVNKKMELENKLEEEYGVLHTWYSFAQEKINVTIYGVDNFIKGVSQGSVSVKEIDDEVYSYQAIYQIDDMAVTIYLKRSELEDFVERGKENGLTIKFE